jgi:hypothetical protein
VPRNVTDRNGACCTLREQHSDMWTAISLAGRRRM